MLKYLLISFLFIGSSFGATYYDTVIDKNDLPLKLERHKRLYFVSGPENTKVQLSLKWNFIKDSNFYFGYTEYFFWRLFQDRSSPFRDINHNPELFYRFRFDDSMMLDAGAEHLSNGKADEESRSWNTAYVRGVKKWDDKYQLAVKVYGLFDVEKTNHDIEKYIGWFDFEFSINEFIKSKFQNNEFFVRWRPGGEMSWSDRYDTFELGLKIKFSSLKVFQHMFITYYNGYAENQLEYKKNVRTLRVGVTF